MAVRLAAPFALMLASLLAVPQSASAHGICAMSHRAHAHHRLVHHVAYHIPRFDQAQAEAEVHTEYRYRTPYLPYWVVP